MFASSMASSAKRRAVGLGENPEDCEDNSSDEGLEDDDESGEEDSEASDEEINEQAEVPEDSDNEGDLDEVFGFISMLNLTERKGVQCVEDVKQLVLAQCEKNCPHSMTEQLEKVLNDTSKPVGLLLSERFINVPPQIALPLHKQLQDEMAEAQRTNKPSGRCHFCLMISKTCKEANKTIQARGQAPKEELMFANAEEEFFYEQATIKFNYSVQEETDSCLTGRWSFNDVPMKPYRTVMLIPADRMPTIMEKLKEFLTL